MRFLLTRPALVLIAAALCVASCADATTDVASGEADLPTLSSKADSGRLLEDVDWANQFFLTQVYDETWNPSGVVTDSESNNCGPASLAMLMAERGVVPTDLDPETAIDHARATMYPGYPDIDPAILPEGVSVTVERDLVLVDDDTDPVYFDVMTDKPSVAQGITAAGGTPVTGSDWSELDDLLEAHGAVIAYGLITEDWRNRFSGDYGAVDADDVSHFILLFEAREIGSFIVCDPMHRGGAVVMPQDELRTFFRVPDRPFQTSMRLVAWERVEALEPDPGAEEVTVEEEEAPVEADPYAMARDITAHHVTFDDSVEASPYEMPQTNTGFRLTGTEFWQKWSGGKKPTYNFNDGTAYGRRCMVASAKRFEAIMSDPPQELKDLKLNSNWSGLFFNWNDDYSQSDWGDASTAKMWAWRTSLIKWISQTGLDGSCYLPTMEMVMALIEDCQSKANSSDGEIMGCRAP